MNRAYKFKVRLGNCGIVGRYGLRVTGFIFPGFTVDLQLSHTNKVGYCGLSGADLNPSNKSRGRKKSPKKKQKKRNHKAKKRDKNWNNRKGWNR